MAITADSIDKAVWTFCYETLGGGRRRKLPWAFVRFGTEGDETYVVPVCGPVTGASAGHVPLPPDTLIEGDPVFMDNVPFPQEANRRRSNGPGDANIGGPVALHYFGGV
jgi:hypothetical protein